MPKAQSQPKAIMDILTVDAQSQGFPGADTWSYSHMRYQHESMRRYGAAEIYRESYLAFIDSLTLRRRHQLVREYGALQEYWPDAMGRRLPNIPAVLQRAKLIHLENFKIAAGFELFINAALIENGYLAHKIRKNEPLCQEQRVRPISVAEFEALRPSRFDGTQNYLPGLDQASINFNGLLLATYCSATGISVYERKVIEEYRQSRNRIHLPADFCGAGLKAQDLGSKIEFLVNFVNKQLVTRFTNLNAQLDATLPEIKLLSMP